MITTGRETETYFYLWNASSELFTTHAQDPESELPEIRYSSATFIDVNNDNNLDISLFGYNDTIHLSKIYTNNITTPNTAPSPPSGSDNFSASYANGMLTLTWGNGSDTETPTMGLYYNLRVGVASGGNDIVSGVYGGSSNPTAGYFGNMMQRKSISLRIGDLEPNQTVYWSVQSIDTGLAKSAWSAEQNYTLPINIVDPTVTLNAPADHNRTNTTRLIFNATISDDNNVSNVTLYGNWTGAWAINETNTSSINNTHYSFDIDLSGYGEGDYLWTIRACDNSSNCVYHNRTVTIDTTYPVIRLLSPSSGSTWTSGNTLSLAFNATDRSVTSCTLFSNYLESDTNYTVTPNVQQVFTKTMSNGVYTWYVNCTDSAGQMNGSAVWTITVSYSSGGGGGSSSGGGGSSAPSTGSTTKAWDRISSGGSGSMSIDSDSIGITEITFAVSEDVSKPSLSVSVGREADVPEIPTASAQGAQQHTYQYLSIGATNIDDAKLANATIRFRVSNAWIEQNQINRSTVKLNRYTNSQWTPLGTSVLTQDANHTYYEATTPGFSSFAVTGNIVSAQGLPEANCTEGEMQCSLNELVGCVNGTWQHVLTCDYGCSNETGTCVWKQAEPSGGEWWWVVAAGAGVAAGCIGVVVYWKFRIKE